MLFISLSRFAKTPPNAVGAFWMLVSALSFTLMAVCLQELAARGFAESQMVFFRCAAGFALLLPLAFREGPSVWAVKRPRQVLLRAALSTAGFFAGFYALAHLPLADAQALSFSRVLFVVVFAAWLLREQVAWRRWTATLIGFVGVLIMLAPLFFGETPQAMPHSDEYWQATAAALVSALLFGAAIVTVKDLTRDHTTLQLVLYTNAFTSLAGLPFAFLGWRDPNLVEWALFLALGFLGLGAQSAYVRALASGDASLLGLIDYVRLPLAAFFGYVFFATAPSVYTLAGAAVIIASTIYITWREARLGREKPVAGPEP